MDPKETVESISPEEVNANPSTHKEADQGLRDSDKNSASPSLPFDPFSETPPSPSSFESTNNAELGDSNSPSGFDPFDTSSEPDSNDKTQEDKVPLGDVFDLPPDNGESTESPTPFPEAPPAPPTFDPFAE